MHCLEVIQHVNAKAQTKADVEFLLEDPARREYVINGLPSHGWIVQRCYQGQPGVIHVSHPDCEQYSVTVDCSDPLQDHELVEFHKHWPGPKWVRHEVELAASQHRRERLAGAV